MPHRPPAIACPDLRALRAGACPDAHRGGLSPSDNQRDQIGGARNEYLGRLRLTAPQRRFYRSLPRATREPHRWKRPRKGTFYFSGGFTRSSRPYSIHAKSLAGEANSPRRSTPAPTPILYNPDQER